MRGQQETSNLLPVSDRFHILKSPRPLPLRSCPGYPNLNMLIEQFYRFSFFPTKRRVFFRLYQWLCNICIMRPSFPSPPHCVFCIIVLSSYHQVQNCHIKCNEDGLTQSGEGRQTSQPSQQRQNNNYCLPTAPHQQTDCLLCLCATVFLSVSSFNEDQFTMSQHHSQYYVYLSTV